MSNMKDSIFSDLIWEFSCQSNLRSRIGGGIFIPWIGTVSNFLDIGKSIIVIIQVIKVLNSILIEVFHYIGHSNG